MKYYDLTIKNLKKSVMRMFDFQASLDSDYPLLMAGEESVGSSVCKEEEPTMLPDNDMMPRHRCYLCD